MSLRHLFAVPLVAAALVLSGCTGGGAEETSSEATDESGASVEDAPDAGGDTEVGTAEATDSGVVMAEQTVDTPSKAGGTLTATLRTVEVRDEATTIRYAVRWDAEDAEADAYEGHLGLGIDWIPTVVDTDALIQYRPFCTDGSWQDGTIQQIFCAQSATVSPGDNFRGFLNGATIEGWAQLPAPEGKPATLDISIGEGLPVFTGATVTYAEAQE